METRTRYSAAGGTAYLLGRPASRWIDALSTRRHAPERAPNRSLPASEGRS
jgi:hypothetical protein